LHQELAERHAAGKPVRIGLIGAGQMGTDVVATVSMMKGIDVPAVADVNISRAKASYEIAGLKGQVVEARTAAEADSAVEAGKKVVARDYRVVADMKCLDVMVEATGVPEVGAWAVKVMVTRVKVPAG